MYDTQYQLLNLALFYHNYFYFQWSGKQNGLPFLARSSLFFFLENAETNSNLFFHIVRKMKCSLFTRFLIMHAFFQSSTSLIPTTNTTVLKNKSPN